MQRAYSLQNTADTWTNVNMLAEVVTSFASDFYWLGSLFDVISGCKIGAIGLSVGGVVFPPPKTPS